MRNWKELSLIQKLIIGLFIIVLAALAPELALLMDLGGIELAFTFMLMYLKPLFLWLKVKYEAIRELGNIAYIAFINSASFKPKVYLTQASFCCIAMVFTGSLVFSMSFLLPGFLFTGMLV